MRKQTLFQNEVYIPSYFFEVLLFETACLKCMFVTTYISRPNRIFFAKAVSGNKKCVFVLQLFHRITRVEFEHEHM